MNKILKNIKTKSWDTKVSNDEAGIRSISPSKVLDSIQEEKDWDMIAEKCSVNPRHELFGTPMKEIRDIWEKRGKVGMHRGNVIDTAVTHTLETGKKMILNAEDAKDEMLVKKYDQFLKFYEIHLKQLTYIGSEIWLTSKEGINGRLDALFEFYHNETQKKYLMIFDWKNNEKLSLDNRWNKLLGPASHLDDSDINKMTIQTQLYQYVLATEYGFDVAGTRIGQIKADEMISHKPAFKYDPDFIKRLIEFGKDKHIKK